MHHWDSGAAPLPFRPPREDTVAVVSREDFQALRDGQAPMSFSPPAVTQIALPPGAGAVHGPGPVQCDDSSDDDEERGIYKVKFGADDTGALGISFKEVSIKTVNPSGMGQYRARRTLEPGMVLRAINGVPADRLAYNACVPFAAKLCGNASHALPLPTGHCAH